MPRAVQAQASATFAMAESRPCAPASAFESAGRCTFLPALQAEVDFLREAGVGVCSKTGMIVCVWCGVGCVAAPLSANRSSPLVTHFMARVHSPRLRRPEATAVHRHAMAVSAAVRATVNEAVRESYVRPRLAQAKLQPLAWAPQKLLILCPDCPTGFARHSAYRMHRKTFHRKSSAPKKAAELAQALVMGRSSAAFPVCSAEAPLNTGNSVDELSVSAGRRGEWSAPTNATPPPLAMPPQPIAPAVDTLAGPAQGQTEVEIIKWRIFLR